VVAAGLSACLGGCNAALLDPRGPIGQDEKTILIDSVVIMLAIVIPTILAILGFAWWYRASNRRARYLPQFAYSGRIEIVVWSIPIMVIILLGGVTWIGSHSLDPATPLASKEPPLDIQVVSLDWKWLFIYPAQGVATLNQLVVPTDAALHFTLTSASVMNTFFIPQLGSMIYTMNGMATELNLRAAAPGTYRGISGHYSGDGFSDMHFDVRAVAPNEFATWVGTVQGAGAALDATAYAALAVQSTNLPPATFGSVEHDLFKKIVSQRIAPGPGPVAEPVAEPAAADADADHAAQIALQAPTGAAQPRTIAAER
jgi:cytochrome o ubiquinol oxidase subunit 2